MGERCVANSRLMRFAVIAYDSPPAISSDVKTQIPPANGSWACVWGPYTDSIIAINALAYVVQNQESNEYAVVMRGTTPGSLTYWHFDLETWPMVSLNPYIPIAPTGITTATGSLDEFQKMIAANPRMLAENLAEELLTYGTGAPVSFADRDVIASIAEQSAKDGYGFRSVLYGVIESATFQSK